ncbi:MAG: GDP-mannose 4,6-dehydratase [Nitrospirae bacterium]|nr:GDP-mannose 4,6-dehydratase [Nitrospirota bacterium]
MTELLDARSWLITGGCGFIGSTLIYRLLKEVPGVNIRILDNLSSGSRDALSGAGPFIEKDVLSLKGRPEGLELVIGDIRNPEACIRCCSSVDVVVHLAASTGVPQSVENPRADMEANVIGTLNMLEASRRQGIKKFIFASSGAPLGDVVPPVHEDKAPRPVSPYGASKLAGEAYCSAYFRTFGVKTIALRFSNVYGHLSKNKNSVVAKFFKNALAGERIEIYGNGEQTRDFIFIEDLINAIMLSVKADIGGEVFQIATHKETTVNEIAEAIKEIVKKETGRDVNIIYSEQRPGDVKRNFADISKAKNILGFEPEHDLKSGLKKTFKYFKNSK